MTQDTKSSTNTNTNTTCLSPTNSANEYPSSRFYFCPPTPPTSASRVVILNKYEQDSMITTRGNDSSLPKSQNDKLSHPVAHNRPHTHNDDSNYSNHRHGHNHNGNDNSNANNENDDDNNNNQSNHIKQRFIHINHCVDDGDGDVDDKDRLSGERMDRLFERKRKRRESHNVVERRRRDNINARIDELSSLIPPQQQMQKLNRGVILQNSVDHIRLLHRRVNEQQQRIRELESMLNAANIMWKEDGKVEYPIIAQNQQREPQHRQQLPSISNVRTTVGDR